jgi:hypothetical protein
VELHPGSRGLVLSIDEASQVSQQRRPLAVPSYSVTLADNIARSTNQEVDGRRSIVKVYPKVFR